MLIDSVIQKEALRNIEMISQYEDLLRELPKGSLICRRKEYYYLKYRDGAKIRDEYIGNNPDTIAQLREQLALRRHCSEMLAALKREQKVIHKMLEGRA